MTKLALTPFDADMKDMYPIPGTRLKQWVVDSRRAREWDLETCPRIPVEPHDDNTGLDCRSAPSAIWKDLTQHDCCHTCEDIAAATCDQPDVEAWIARTDRPSICADKTRLSEEVAPEWNLRDHPALGMLNRRGRR